MKQPLTNQQIQDGIDYLNNKLQKGERVKLLSISDEDMEKYDSEYFKVLNNLEYQRLMWFVENSNFVTKIEQSKELLKQQFPNFTRKDGYFEAKLLDENINQMQSSLQDGEVGVILVKKNDHNHTFPVFVTNKNLLAYQYWMLDDYLLLNEYEKIKGNEKKLYYMQNVLQKDSYNCSTLALALAKVMIKNEAEVFKVINSENQITLDSFSPDIKNQITKYSQDLYLLSNENAKYLERKDLIQTTKDGKILNVILDKKKDKIIKDSLCIETLNAINNKPAWEILNWREQGDMKKYKQEWKKFVQQKEKVEYCNSKI
jgi:hypothetical protein